ncbi:hypothetical protein [Paraburkholderia saeva]|uniref:Uncharacterized protein n=1 Tax=Paraburkholderia saeva TaxID=2777537 RepID=A0A9N8WZN6_9BURK|nr:hypothetical protein [Paraburkholderia saeva]CAG4889808.1 hypothetical protein LMG31841_00900 [Paraburkholderia saeva]
MKLIELIYRNRPVAFTNANSANSANPAPESFPGKAPAPSAPPLTAANAANSGSDHAAALARISNASQITPDGEIPASIAFAGAISKISRISTSKSQMAEIGKTLEHPVGPFWPWAPHLSAADIARLRSELAAMIAGLADLEHWPDDLRAGILDRAARDPLSALLSNVAHFSNRLAEAQADVLAREESARRAWRFDGRR